MDCQYKFQKLSEILVNTSTIMPGACMTYITKKCGPDLLFSVFVPTPWIWKSLPRFAPFQPKTVRFISPPKRIGQETWMSSPLLGSSCCYKVEITTDWCEILMKIKSNFKSTTFWWVKSNIFETIQGGKTSFADQWSCYYSKLYK